MDNTWYYTLSTISQTLAAVLGLAAVFAAIRLENLSKQLKKYRDRGYSVIEIVDSHLKRASSTSGKANGVYKELKKIEEGWEELKKNSGIASDIKGVTKRYEQSLDPSALEFIKDSKHYLGVYIKQRETTFKKIKLTGIISSLTIIYSIFLLSISKLLYCDNVFAMPLFSLAVIFSILSILLIINASWKLLKDSVEKI